jgi:hypothetical protein
MMIATSNAICHVWAIQNNDAHAKPPLQQISALQRYVPEGFSGSLRSTILRAPIAQQFLGPSVLHSVAFGLKGD